MQTIPIQVTQIRNAEVLTIWIQIANEDLPRINKKYFAVIRNAYRQTAAYLLLWPLR